MMTGLYIRRVLLAASLILLPGWLTAAAPGVIVLSIDGAIGPATASYVARGIEHASNDGAQLVLLEIDTPGGLDSAMRVITKAILAAPLPVASYVSPSGARAASAGTYILYASHIAAMTPGTNLGAATPVQIGARATAPAAASNGVRTSLPANDSESRFPSLTPEKDDKPGADGAQTMRDKQINDAAAYIRGLAQLRGRNKEWAEQAVRESASLSAEEALQLQVIDYLAADRASLLQQLDGKTIDVLGQARTLRTANASVVEYLPDWRVQLLATITSPSIALLLLTIGIYGLIFEFSSPGFGIGGVLGGIFLLLGMYALQLLPVNYAGLALIFLGIGLMTAEAFIPSFGVLGLGGIAAFIFGAVILIDTDLPGFGIPLGLIIAVATINAALIVTIVGIALKMHRRPAVSGASTLVGSSAEVIEDCDPEGWVQIQGESWRAISDSPLRRGTAAQVIARNGLVLTVAALDAPPPTNTDTIHHAHTPGARS